MKQSLFTIEFDTDNESTSKSKSRVLFNTLNGALALVSNKVTQAELVKGGFFVDDDLDEEEQFAQRFLHDMNATNFLVLCITPTMECNLRCIYCYEKHEPVQMTDEVERAIERFVQRRYDLYGFKDIEIIWYGGEPLLEMERIERISKRAIQWCKSNNVHYHANIITNATLINADIAKKLSNLQISEAMPTLDGTQCVHDAKRMQTNGNGSYVQTLQGIKELCKVGINVGANLNLAWDNIKDYQKLKKELQTNQNCTLYASHLRNYGHWCHECDEGTDNFPGNHHPLMSRPAYAKQLFEFYRQTNPSSASLSEVLRSKRAFCHGKMASYFVIDPQGYTYRCDGHMRNPKHRLFNVLDEDFPILSPETKTLYERNSKCKSCAIIPLCLGDCNWEWEMFKDNCSALKYTLKDYVMLYIEKTGARLNKGQTMLQLIPPTDVAARYAVPFSPFSDDSVMQ